MYTSWRKKKKKAGVDRTKKKVKGMIVRSRAKWIVYICRGVGIGS